MYFRIFVILEKKTEFFVVRVGRPHSYKCYLNNLDIKTTPSRRNATRKTGRFSQLAFTHCEYFVHEFTNKLSSS